MPQPIAIADEITAAGLRLAGLRTMVVEPADVEHAFEEACSTAPLVFVTAELARYLPRARLAAALEAGAPVVGVIPDIEERSIVPDLGAELRRVLGVS